MKVNVIDRPVPGLFTAMIVPEQRQTTAEWLTNQFANVASSHLTDAGRAFMQQAKEAYDALTDINLQAMTRKVIRNVAGLFDPNTIRDLATVRDLQLAKPVMQRYLMANPVIRRIYHDQLCDGYSDSYVDQAPKSIGFGHYDYHRVMDGIVESITLDDGTEGWKATTYLDDLIEGDRHLDLEEQSLILKAWSLMNKTIASGFDPTDLYNGKL